MTFSTAPVLVGSLAIPSWLAVTELAAAMMAVASTRFRSRAMPTACALLITWSSSKASTKLVTVSSS